MGLPVKPGTGSHQRAELEAKTVWIIFATALPTREICTQQIYCSTSRAYESMGYEPL